MYICQVEIYRGCRVVLPWIYSAVCMFMVDVCVVGSGRSKYSLRANTAFILSNNRRNNARCRFHLALIDSLLRVTKRWITQCWNSRASAVQLGQAAKKTSRTCACLGRTSLLCVFDFHIRQDGCCWAWLSQSCTRRSREPQRKSEVTRTCSERERLHISPVFMASGGWICLRTCVGVALLISQSWQGNGYTLQSHNEMTLIKQII